MRKWTYYATILHVTSSTTSSQVITAQGVVWCCIWLNSLYVWQNRKEKYYNLTESMSLETRSS